MVNAHIVIALAVTVVVDRPPIVEEIVTDVAVERQNVSVAQARPVVGIVRTVAVVDVAARELPVREHVPNALTRTRKD